MSTVYEIVKFAFAIGMFTAGLMKLTDAISAEVHGELVTQLDAFAVEPWGFLGMSGEHFRLAIGYTEAVGAIATLLPWKPARSAALLLLVLLLHGAWGTHMVVGDKKGTPALVFAGMAMMLLTGGGGKLAKPKNSTTAPSAEKKKD